MSSSPVYTSLYSSTHNYKDEKALKARRSLYSYTEPKFNIYAELIDEIRARHPESLLDVACGYGDMLISLRRDYHSEIKLVGIDSSDGILEHAQEIVAQDNLRIDFSQADALALPFADAEFHAITCNFSLYQFENIPRAIEEIHRVLAPGGYFFAAMHQKGNRPRVLEYIQKLAAILEMEAPHLPQDRLNLDTIQPYLGGFEAMEFRRFEGVITLSEPEPFISYLRSLRDHIFYPEPDPEVWEAALKEVRPLIETEITEKGSFQEQTKVGIVICRKPA